MGHGEHPCVWRDESICVTCHIEMCDVKHSYVYVVMSSIHTCFHMQIWGCEYANAHMPMWWCESANSQMWWCEFAIVWCEVIVCVRWPSPHVVMWSIHVFIRMWWCEVCKCVMWSNRRCKMTASSSFDEKSFYEVILILMEEVLILMDEVILHICRWISCLMRLSSWGHQYS